MMESPLAQRRQPVQLNYRDTGPRGTAIPVILIHGLFGSLDNLSQLARVLQEERRVISLDMRNHGASSYNFV